MNAQPQLLGKTDLVVDKQIWYDRIGKYYMVEQPELITPVKIKHHHLPWHRK